MNTQVNLRIPPKLLADIKRETKERGYSTVQAFILQVLRDEVMDLTPRERQALVRSLAAAERRPVLSEEATWAVLGGRKISGSKGRVEKKAAHQPDAWRSPSISTSRSSGTSRTSVKTPGN